MSGLAIPSAFGTDAGKLRRVARELLALAAKLDGNAAPAERAPDRGSSVLAVARAVYRARRVRERSVPPGLFSEPAWDILLDLCIAQESGRRVSVSSACVASTVAHTTALRWIDELVKNELVVRDDDPRGPRLSFLSLTPRGHRIVHECLTAGAAVQLRPEDA